MDFMAASASGAVRPIRDRFSNGTRKVLESIVMALSFKSV